MTRLFLVLKTSLTVFKTFVIARLVKLQLVQYQNVKSMFSLKELIVFLYLSLMKTCYKKPLALIQFPMQLHEHYKDGDASGDVLLAKLLVTYLTICIDKWNGQ